ncbi:hypothetical protein G6F22_016196 [Rhizopus arrhizus]|nr:hypothetical protein G6F22_016196 [Rhizopus arrhizus]
MRGRAEARARRCQDQVGGQGQAQPGAIGRAVDCRDHRPVQRDQAFYRQEQAGHALPRFLGGTAGPHGGDVSARADGAAGARQDHDANAAVAPDRVH